MILEKTLPKRVINKQREMEYEQDEFTPYQNFLYKRVIFGLSMYPKEQIVKMHFDKKKRIIKVSKHAQEVLNLWKQELFILMSNRILETLFPNSSLARMIVKRFSKPDPYFTNGWDFKRLRINKKLIVDKLINEGVLPINFHELKEKRVLQSDRSRDHISVL